ncbi:hypothetical protein P154DRAFT_497567 [Amniculicola lignicola CBS 123094]|uniref:Rhodopsin domain-containing protein n=1 Tax=Amniculicola lignicola CBS 123094 TaxID=1392246 RepID=A0A6A5W7V8_9PLEO|nr:hypothetical protein P154DRAFT_497567 [Amniculicola lignicola CBS 123094]
MTRLRILHFVGGEDWCIWSAYMLSIGNTIGMTYQAKFALGRHLVTLSPEQLSSCLKAFYATVLSYNMSLTFTKLSILLQYLRIFKVRKLRFACYALIVIVALYGLEMFITSAFPCWPVASFWDSHLKGICFPHKDIWFTNAALNIATDLMIFMLPIPVIKGLNLPTRQKAALLGVFILGFFVCIISILRLPSLHKAVVSTDFSYENIGIAVWSCIEVNVAIVCACLPALKPLISHFFPGLSTTKHTSRSNYMRYGSGRDVANRRPWNKSTLSKAETSVTTKTVHDSESGTGTVPEGEDLVLDCFELQARKANAKEKMRHSETTERHNESSGCTSKNGDLDK